MVEALRFGELMEIRCDSCGKTSAPSVTHETELIKHLCCSDCGNVDAFEIEKPSEEKRRPAPALLNHEVLMGRSTASELVSYSTKNAYSDGQYLEHAKFGAGYVLNVRNPASKMVVLFEDQKRLLVCEPGPRSVVTRNATSGIKQKAVKPGKAAEASKASSPKKDEELRRCPACKKMVHPFNLTRNPKGKTLGCTFCKQSR